MHLRYTQSMKKIVNVLSLVLTLALMLSTAYLTFESNEAIALSATDTVVITLTVDAGISITDAPNRSMSQSLGVAADTAVASSTWNVKTNNALGYALSVRASTTPAMQSGSNSITDYQTGSPNTWSVTNDARFGYSAYGTDVSTGTWGTGSNCQAAAHVPSASLNYKGFTTTNFQIATRSATTTTAGIDTTVCYAVEQDTFYIPSGTYTATIIATATTL